MLCQYKNNKYSHIQCCQFIPSMCDWIYELMMRFAWGMCVYSLGTVIKIKAVCELTFSNLLWCHCNSNCQYKRRVLLSGAVSYYIILLLLCEDFPVRGKPPINWVLLYCVFFLWHINWIFYLGIICKTTNLRWYFGQVCSNKNGCNFMVCRSIHAGMFWSKYRLWLSVRDHFQPMLRLNRAHSSTLMQHNRITLTVPSRSTGDWREIKLLAAPCRLALNVHSASCYLLFCLSICSSAAHLMA